MSDNQQPLTLDQQKMQEIMTHDTRTAVNMEKTRTGYDREYYSVEAKNKAQIDALIGDAVGYLDAHYDQEYYSMDKTMEDTRFISRVLRGVDAQELNLTEQDKQHLRIVNSRNKSHILLNQQKFLGDSGLMQTVKESVSRLESMLAAENTSILWLNDIQEAYLTAISACRTYRDNKNPWFPKGKARKQMVEKRLNALQRELELFKSARATIASSGEGFPLRPIDLFDLAETIKNRQQNNEPGNPEERQEEQVIAENIQKEPVVEEIVEEKKEESVIEKEKTDEKKEEIKKEEKIIVEEKKEQVIAENIQKEPVVEEIVEEKKEESVIEKEKTDEKKEEVKKEEKIIVEEKKEEKIEVKLTEEEILQNMHEKLRWVKMPSQKTIEAADKRLEEEKKNLMSKVKTPELHIKRKAIRKNYKELEDLLYSFHEMVRYQYYNKRQEQYHYAYNYEIRDEWTPIFRKFESGYDPSVFDGVIKVAQIIIKEDKYEEDVEKARKLINKMNEFHSDAAKDSPLIEPEEMEALLKKLSGTYVEQKQAVTALQKYHNDIGEWGKDSTKKTVYNREGMDLDMEMMQDDIRNILENQRKKNPVIFDMTEEEVLAYQEEVAPELKQKRLEEEKRRAEERDANELKDMVQSSIKKEQTKDLRDAKADLEERTEKKIKEYEAKIAANEEKLKQEEEAFKKQEEADLKKKSEMEAKLAAKQKELDEKEAKRRQEEQRIRKEEEKRIRKEQEELKKKQEEEERIRKEAEKKEQEKKKEDTLYDTSDDIVQTMLKEGEELYKKLKEEAEVCCKNGVALVNLTRARGYNKVQHLLLPLMSEKGCTWDALVMVIRLGAYVGEQYEDYFGARALQNVREKVLLPLIQSEYIPDTDSLTPYDSYLPTDDILLNTKLKFTSNGLVILPEEARKMIASAFSHLDPNEVELFDNSSDFMSSVADVYKDYANRKGISETSFGDNYYGGRFCESTMRKIIGRHPELIG